MLRRWLDPTLLMVCLLGLLTGGVAYAAQRPAWAALAWATGGLVMAGVLAVEMFRRLARGEAGIDLIALLSIGAALALENMLVAAVVALMLATGRALEAFSVRHAERELRALIDRAPQRAWIQEQDGLREVAVDQVRPGQAVLVRLGEIVPVDGRLQSSQATLDEAALTGESLPVTRHCGESVASGVCNAGAPLLLVATRTAAQSTYAGIVHLAETARQSRAPFVRLADRYALAFIPLTLLIAALAWWASGDPQRVLAVLVVATPCPLILAVPIAVLSGISRAARRSILVRDGAVLEALAGVRQVFLDKTGTLTSGHARLQSIELNGDGAPLQVLQWPRHWPRHPPIRSPGLLSTRPSCGALAWRRHNRYRRLQARVWPARCKARPCAWGCWLTCSRAGRRAPGHRRACSSSTIWPAVVVSWPWTVN